MARLLKASCRSLLAACRKTSFPLNPDSKPPFCSITSLLHTQFADESPFKSNLLRILRRDVEYQLEYAPPHQPVTKYDAFMVEDRPGELWVTLSGKSAEDENIKIEATMFDGAISVPKSSDESSAEDVQLHISLLVDIWKSDGSERLEFVCSAWSDCLEIQKVYVFRRDDLSARRYMGPNIRGCNRCRHNVK